MKNSLRIQVLATTAALLMLPLTVGAQLKARDPNALTPSVPSQTQSTANPALSEKQKAGVAVAERWLALLDRKEFGKAWDETAPLFQSNVTRAQWLEGMPKSRAPLGAMKGRTVEGIGVPTPPKEQANLELLQVGFITQFEKQPQAKEAVTLVLDKGTWRPVGYLIQ